MNNEPVAWMDSLGNLTKQNLGDFIPLYTHPVKEQEPDLYSEDGFPLWTSPQFRELTDEEILEIENSCRTEMKEWGNISFIEFARAILRKAQESDKIESLGTVNIGGVHFRNGKEVK